MHYPLLFSFIFTGGLGGLVQHLDGRFENGESSRKEVTCGYFYTSGSGAFVYFLYMGSSRIFGCELCRRRGRGGVEALRRHCGGFSLFLREYHGYGSTRERKLKVIWNVEALIISR